MKNEGKVSLTTAMGISEEHYAELREAKRLLEQPGYMARLADVVGTPIEKAIENLPDRWREKTSDATKAALNTALKVALKTMDVAGNQAYPRLHSIAAAITGAAGGAFGLAALPIELPISTTVMLRSIADIARANGESLQSTEAQLACLLVFSLGGKSPSDDAAESAYFSTRAVLAKAVSEAAAYVAHKGVVIESAPAIIRLISQIATRFNIQVTQKAAATAVPIVGAACGAIINALFIDHFQNMARGHFTIRRLERVYGAETVRRAYQEIEI
jgi:hypothetical protein